MLAQAGAIAEATQRIASLSSKRERTVVLAQIAANALGGARKKGEHNEFGEYEYELSALKVKFKSNVIPLGAIAKGG